MKSIFGMAKAAIVTICVATVLAQAILAATFFLRGGLTSEQTLQVLATIHQVDIEAIREEFSDGTGGESLDQVAHEQVLLARVESGLYIDLREQALELGLAENRNILVELQKQRTQYSRLRDAFNQQLAQVEEGVQQEAIRDVASKLEVMQPRQAKDQILRILDDDTVSPDEAMEAVVAIIKTIPLERGKKILAEFKTPEEATKLFEILRQIRLGEPDVSVIHRMRQQLELFASQHNEA